MPNLIIRQGSSVREVTFEGNPILGDLLGTDAQHPCGGRGVCGKCAVEVSGAVSEPNKAEKAAGSRLSCQVILLGDAEVTLSDKKLMEQIETSGGDALTASAPMEGCLGAAIDIGTTTMALRLYDLKTGAQVGASAMLNPQTSIAADVMGRIGAALNGSLETLQQQVQAAIRTLIDEACAKAGKSADEVDSLVITGNTTMLYLLTGRSPETLSHAPFEADCLFGSMETLLNRTCCLPPCMNAFVGADITCALLESEQCERNEISLLCDIGTNGEIALWKNGELFVTSTAAGPAFEGAGISCGCSSIRGAIDRVWTEDGQLHIHTISDADAVGLCGSGLIDAIAASLELELIDETGAMDDDEIELAPGVALQPKDVRAVQLAKAAIAAGIETLLETANVALDDVSTLYIAGGFGNHLDVNSAARIGLIPEALAARVKAIGNASLAGASRLLLDQNSMRTAREIAGKSQHVNLGGNPKFNEHYIDQMLFPEEDF